MNYDKKISQFNLSTGLICGTVHRMKESLKSILSEEIVTIFIVTLSFPLVSI